MKPIPVDDDDWHTWSTVIIRPSLWWRLKMLFKPQDLTFCWGNERWFLGGFTGEDYLSIGGVPTDQRHRFRSK